MILNCHSCPYVRGGVRSARADFPGPTPPLGLTTPDAAAVPGTAEFLFLKPRRSSRLPRTLTKPKRSVSASLERFGREVRRG